MRLIQFILTSFLEQEIPECGRSVSGNVGAGWAGSSGGKLGQGVALGSSLGQEEIASHLFHQQVSEHGAWWLCC